MSGVLIALALVISGAVLILECLKESSHMWSYRNPHDRMCLKCGRHENQFDDGSWECMYPTAHSPERCKSEEQS